MELQKHLNSKEDEEDEMVHPLFMDGPPTQHSFKTNTSLQALVALLEDTPQLPYTPIRRIARGRQSLESIPCINENLKSKHDIMCCSNSAAQSLNSFSENNPSFNKEFSNLLFTTEFNRTFGSSKNLNNNHSNIAPYAPVNLQNYLFSYNKNLIHQPTSNHITNQQNNQSPQININMLPHFSNNANMIFPPIQTPQTVSYNTFNNNSIQSPHEMPSSPVETSPTDTPSSNRTSINTSSPPHDEPSSPSNLNILSTSSINLSPLNNQTIHVDEQHILTNQLSPNSIHELHIGLSLLSLK